MALHLQSLSLAHHKASLLKPPLGNFEDQQQDQLQDRSEANTVESLARICQACPQF